ncbi:unnamed protein product, partial [Prorocentrum cordatum]
MSDGAIRAVDLAIEGAVSTRGANPSAAAWEELLGTLRAKRAALQSKLLAARQDEAIAKLDELRRDAAQQLPVQKR